MSQSDDSPPPLSAYAQRFAQAHGQAPVWAAAAPGRVNLIGEHIDYNDGFVLPAAINREVTMLAAPLETAEIRLRSESYDQETTLSLSDLPNAEDTEWPWVKYLLGVLAGFARVGIKVPGMRVSIESTVPVGSGLSSSAALEVAFATLLEQVTGAALPRRQKALLCQRAEHEFAGVPCGIMDQFASVLGERDHFLLIDCRSIDIQPIAFQDPAMTLLISNTNVSHSLASGEYAKRKAQCDHALHQLGQPSWRFVTEDQLAAASGLLDELHFRRARHVVTEIKRTQQAVDAIGERAWGELGDLMAASHASLRDDFEVSCAELDLVVEMASDLGQDRGVYGARMTGGGFGGSVVSLVATAQAEHLAEVYQKRYKLHTGNDLEVFTTRPCAGARVEEGLPS